MLQLTDGAGDGQMDGAERRRRSKGAAPKPVVVIMRSPLKKEMRTRKRNAANKHEGRREGLDEMKEKENQQPDGMEKKQIQGRGGADPRPPKPAGEQKRIEARRAGAVDEKIHRNTKGGLDEMEEK